MMRRMRARSASLLAAVVHAASLCACSDSEPASSSASSSSGGAGASGAAGQGASGAGIGGAGGGAGSASGGAGGATGGAGNGGGGGAPAAEACRASAGEVEVTDADTLTAALQAAQPGTVIRMAPGTYLGTFATSAVGTAEAPIALCGTRAAIIDGGDVESGYALHLDGAEHWVLAGFEVTNAQKGIMLDGSSHNLLTGLLVHEIGDEAVHFRRFSNDNLITFSEIRDTGKREPKFGEGVYIGTAVSNWEDITGSGDTPDTSDGNRVLENAFGPGVTAEHLDLKEGTTGGEVRGNTFDGVGLSGENFADSWMDVKGNGYVIAENVGTTALEDGFQTHVVEDGWGNDNVFSANTATVDGPGYGFNIASASTGNVVHCDNVVTGAAAGFANVDCQP